MGGASLALAAGVGPALAQAAPAFPGALGWAARTPGGRGGRIIRVTTLASDGPGSLRAAVAEKGPRIVVFEVGGVIDLDRRNIKINEPFLTIAGQTAPSPGITLIRGGVGVSTHDVVIRHIRVRPGEAGQAKKSGWECDALACDRAHDVIVDHCSLTWATDENLSASGPRFDGADPDAWRAATSRGITFSNNIVAEGLSNATHSKGEHSKGSLIHDNVTEALVVGNLYSHNRERNPLFKGGTEGVVTNNFIYDPGKRAVHYNLHAKEWGEHPFQRGRLAVVGNVVQAGPSTLDGLALFQLGGEGELELFARDNLGLDRTGAPLAVFGRFGDSTPGLIEATEAPVWPAGFKALSASAVKAAVLREAGARPWDRDAVDARIVREAAEGTGQIIDSEQEVGGYPAYAETRRAFREADWNLADMSPKRPEVLTAVE
ncbi:pectate lyase [Caulobacter sp. 17J80-11]|nr:pectate lyase [Caulobacter sp. 17J80-11]